MVKTKTVSKYTILRMEIQADKRFAAVIGGPVLPLRRHMQVMHRARGNQKGLFRSRIVNPSGHDQENMRNTILVALPKVPKNLVFSTPHALVLDVHFYLPRPDYHFEAKKARSEETVLPQY